MSLPNFWTDQESAQTKVREMKLAKTAVDSFSELYKGLEDVAELIRICSDDDHKIIDEVQIDIKKLAMQVDELEFQTLLSGKNDSKPVFLSIHAGAGGTDSCDWAQMLLRMYMRWLERNSYAIATIDCLGNEEAGIKRIMLRIDGKYPFGYLKLTLALHGSYVYRLSMPISEDIQASRVLILHQNTMM